MGAEIKRGERTTSLRRKTCEIRRPALCDFKVPEQTAHYSHGSTVSVPVAVLADCLGSRHIAPILDKYLRLPRHNAPTSVLDHLGTKANEDTEHRSSESRL